MLLSITAVSLGLAIAMTIVAWRLVRRERLRSRARVAALAAEVRRDPLADLPIYRAESVAQRPLPAAPVIGETMFAPSTTPNRPRVSAAIAAGVFIVGSGAALAVALSGSSSSGRAAGNQTAQSAAHKPAAGPLELVALGHERDGDALGVHGTVRNPRGGSQVDGLSAVVFLFRRDGSFATSTNAPVVPPVLPPGGEASFRIVVPNADDVARYRVSFRTDQQVVPHIDRRDATPERRR